MKKLFSTAVVALISMVVLFAQQKKPVATKPKTTAAPQSAILRGKEVYNKLCIACHQKDGGGVPRLNPPLIKTTYVLGDKARLIKVVLKGLNQPLEIEDETYTNPMPAQPQLSDQQVADVLSYVRNNFGNKASQITPMEVKNVRAKAK